MDDRYTPPRGRIRNPIESGFPMDKTKSKFYRHIKMSRFINSSIRTVMVIAIGSVLGNASADVPRRTTTDGPPAIPEPAEGKVHGEDYHHAKDPVEMSNEATAIEYDRSLFGPDPSYPDKPYDVEEQLKIYGGKYKIENTPRPWIEWPWPMYQEGPLGAGSDLFGEKNLLRPQLIAFGDLRLVTAHNDNGAVDTSQMAARLNLFLDFRLTATERINVFLRPLDKRGKSMRYEFGGNQKDLRGESTEGAFDIDPEGFFFEGELGSIISGLTDSHTKFDIPISFGLMPLFFQNGVWMDDAFVGGAFSLTAMNSPSLDITNMDITFFGGFDHLTTKAIVNRNGGFDDHDSKIFGIATFIDWREMYIEAGYGYTIDTRADARGDFSYHNLTLAVTKRYFGKVSNSIRAVWNVGQDPGFGLSKNADGYMLLIENSLITSLPSTLVPYANFYVGKNKTQSLARDAGAGGIIKNTGINFETDGVTGFPKLDDTGLDSAGVAIGVSYLFDLNQQVVFEIAGLTPLGDDTVGGRGAAGNQFALGFRWQRPLSKEWIIRTDGMLGFRENQEDLGGIRAELRLKF
ncbi:MAG: hypothetical protein VX986_05475 [Pseudomonadota bacterium]|nr:hypothetical protein [Pseudomonadota bacterium]